MFHMSVNRHRRRIAFSVIMIACMAVVSLSATYACLWYKNYLVYELKWEQGATVAGLINTSQVGSIGRILPAHCIIVLPLV
jgi:hypothetical protein